MKEIIKKAQKRKHKILSESQKSLEEKLSLQREEEDANIADQQVDLEETMKEIEAGEQFAEHIESRIQKSENEINQHRSRVDKLKNQYKIKNDKYHVLRFISNWECKF